MPPVGVLAESQQWTLEPTGLTHLAPEAIILSSTGVGMKGPHIDLSS